MNSSLLFSLILLSCLFTSLNLLSLAVDSDNLQDTCPTQSSTHQAIFLNGFPCKNPTNITASDFKSSALNQPGDTDNFVRSSVSLVTASDFPGLNTLGLSAARTDLDVDGLVMPHSHPRASEMLFVAQGVVIVGFVDTDNTLFQKVLRQGDVFVVPRGLLHYCLNFGFEFATIYSVLNGQNPGVVDISDAMFGSNDVESVEAVQLLMSRVVSLSKLEVDRIENVTLHGV